MIRILFFTEKTATFPNDTRVTAEKKGKIQAVH